MASTEPCDVLILGGGFAGLSAATVLAERCARVTVLEKRPHLGGRAYSFFDPRLNQAVDNGQHLFMGCYRETRTFLRRIGANNLLEFSREIRVHYADQEGQRSALSCPTWLGSPAHLAAGVLGLGGLSLADKWSMRKLGAWFKTQGRNGSSSSLDQVTVAQWLTSLDQTQNLQERFYFPIALGALNEDPRRASALGFVQALREIFFSDVDSSRLGLAKVGLSDLYTSQSQAYLKQRGSTVVTGQRVSAIREEGGKMSVLSEQGRTFSARAIISTLAPWDLTKIQLPSVFNQAPWKNLKPSPILGINLWLDRPVFSEPFFGLLGTEIQWAFNRSRLWSLSSNEGQALALVISGAHEHAGRSPQELFQIARRDLERCFPQAKKSKISRWTVVKEPFATLSPVPGSDALRPEHKTPIRGFFLAGDWTQTGLSATIESAVKSGHMCAQLAMEETR